MSTSNQVPDLAVIIPARNEAPRLGQCLDSVRQALDFAGLAAELIVVDDDSTDETVAVARAHGALALRQPRRLGPLAAWSAGVAASVAPLVAFVDADCRVGAAAFSALLGGFTQPAVGVIAARSVPESPCGPGSLAERSAIFSALLLHAVKSRLGSHDFLPIGRLIALRRAAWRDGDHRWPCDRTVALRARRAGWEIRYVPEAEVYYQPVRTYREVRSDYVRTTIAQARLLGAWTEPVPRRVTARAAAASLRQDPLGAAAWLALRARLRGARAAGLMHPDEAYFRWSRSEPEPSGADRGTSAEATYGNPA